MATISEKLATSLALLEKLQKDERRVFRSSEFTRVHRQRLLQNGFLREVMKGWLILSSPGAESSDTTPWYASFWDFCARYCNERFGDEWYLSPEQSLTLHAENTVVPKQLVVYTPSGTNNLVQLLFGTSLYDLKQKQMPPAVDLTERDGLRLFTPEAGLIKVSEVFFKRSPVEAQIALSTIRDASDVLGRLLDGGHSTVAGRLVGALRRIEKHDIADEILRSMRAVGYDVRESDPFRPQQNTGEISRTSAPIAGRLQVLWQTFREPVIAVFPEAPGLPTDEKAYLQLIEKIYQNDAYHSLSIEGYRVTPELIERVRVGDWDSGNINIDRQNQEAFVARGYWQAFQLVKETIAMVAAGGDPSSLVRAACPDWYRELFQPSVVAGLLPASALAGYRNSSVFLRGSRHVPPRWETVPDAIPALFELMENETEASVRAVLGHWLFGHIHPYQDGNGRMARFVMNAMLASGGYPWTVIRVEDRDAYLNALEAASIGLEIEPFAQFVAQQVQWSLMNQA